MTKTIEELQAQRIKELDESRNDLYARINELKNKLEVATDQCVWFANKNHQLHADKDKLKATNESLVKSINAANAFIGDLVERNKTIEELQAQRIKELDESIKKLSHQVEKLKATNESLVKSIDAAHAFIDDCQSTIKSQNGILSSRLDEYIDLANFLFDQSLIGDDEELRKFDDISGLRYEYMAEAIYKLLHTEQSPERFFKLLKRHNPDL